MKKEGSLKITLSILVITLVTLISMWGVNVKSGSTMKNKLPDYEYGMELKSTNIINLEVVKKETSEENTAEETATAQEQTGEATTENAEVATAEQPEATEQKKEEKKEENNVKEYRKAKSILEKRFALMEVNQYTIRLNEKTGNMAIEVPTEFASLVSQNAFSKGKFEIKISDNEEVIADNKSVQEVKTSINNQYANVQGYGSIVELNFVFNKDAVKKFTDIKNNYELTVMHDDSKEDEQAPTGEAQDETSISNTGSVEDRKVNLYLDGNSLYSTTLEDFVKYASTGTLPLSIGGYTDDTKALESSLQQANITKSLIMTENLPVEYTSSSTSNIHSDISKKSIIIVFVVIAAAMIIYLVVRYKLKGLYAGLTILGFISTLLLIVRFTNVALTISSIFALAVTMVLQFIYLIKLLSGKSNTKNFNETTTTFIKILVPVFIMSITISFAKIVELIGFGEVVFWGIIVFAIFNNIITRAMLTNGKNK